MIRSPQAEIEGPDENCPILDLVIVAGMHIEHYEFAGYGAAIALTKAFSEKEVVEASD